MKEMIKLESFYWIRLFCVLYLYAYDANYVHNSYCVFNPLCFNCLLYAWSVDLCVTTPSYNASATHAKQGH